nr:SpoIID/LytB domain-containing protein [Actinomycetota bacterium]
MGRTLLIARIAVLAAITAVAGATPAVAVEAIPAIQVDGRGYGHGVGMAQDGAFAMGLAGATAKQILEQFYPGTTIGKGAGSVRVPVLTGNSVELTFPDGGEIRGDPAPNSPPVTQPLKIAPGGTALIYRDGDGTRVKTAAPSSPTTTSSTSTSSSTTPTTRSPDTTTTTTLLPFPSRQSNQNMPGPAPTTSSTRPSTSTTTTGPQSVAMFVGVVTATPSGGGRIGVTPRNHRYRGIVEMAPVAGGVRFVNQVPVETYLRGMGEVRNPKWPGASLQSQAIAARTYALRAMAAGGELCDTQRCQVYLGSDAEYAAMDKAVAASAGQVLLFGKGLASAVYSANGGAHSATREEGFGQTGPNYPYLRAAPYLSDDPAAWSVTIALRDVASRLNYRGDVTGVEVAERGPSGRATRVTLHGSRGDVTVTGLEFDSALGLRSTLFDLRAVMATTVATLQGGSVLQAPPEQAASQTDVQAVAPTEADPVAFSPPLPVADRDGVGPAGGLALVLW